MTLRERAHAFVQATIWRLSRRTLIDGVHVRYFMPSSPQGVDPFSKVAAALSLVAIFDPRRFDRIRRDLRGVLVMGASGRGEYHQTSRLCILDSAYVESERADPPLLASTIVHEATHARLGRAGIGYDPSIRARVEHACIRAELAFASRLPPLESEIVRSKA